MIEIIETKKRLGMWPVEQRTGKALGYGQLIACPFSDHSHTGKDTPSFGPYAGDDGCPRWKCFACNWQGDVFDFVEKWDHLEKGVALKLLRDTKPVPVSTAPPPAETPHTFDWTIARLQRAVAALAESQPAQAYLAGRGISLETAHGLTFGFESGLVIMPTFVDGQLVAVKRRNIKAKEYYKASRDKNVYYLFARDSINELERVIVVESELDCAMLAAHGFCAVSVDTAGHRFNPADTALLKSAPLVILALDNDTAGYKCAAEIAKLLPEKQRLQIQLPPRIKDLGELYAKAPAEFPAHLRALIRAAETMRRGGLEDLLTEDELIDQQGVEIEYAVENLIPDGKLTMMFGREKSCKSLFAYYVGKCVANGIKVLDSFSVKKMPAIYIDAEDGISGQYAGYMQRLGKVPMRFMNLRTFIPALDDKWLLDLCAEYKPLLIVDSLHKFLKNTSGENVNSFLSAEMEPIMEKLRALCVAGATVIVIHHSTKADSEIYRDSTAIGAGVDFMYAITAEFASGITRVTVKGLPSRGAMPQTLRLLAFPMLIDHGKFAIESGPTPKTNRESLKDYLESVGKPVSKREIRAGLKGMRNEEKDAVLKAAIESGLVVATPTGHNGVDEYQLSACPKAGHTDSPFISVPQAGHSAGTVEADNPF